MAVMGVAVPRAAVTRDGERIAANEDAEWKAVLHVSRKFIVHFPSARQPRAASISARGRT
jgi:hypothetical protein